MIEVTNKRYADLKETESMVESMVESEETRNRSNSMVAHFFIIIVVIMAVATRLF